MKKLVAVGVVICGVELFSGQAAKQIVPIDPAMNRPYSAAATVGGLIYVSGTTARDSKGQISGDIRAQTKTVFEKHAATLKPPSRASSA